MVNSLIRSIFFGQFHATAGPQLLYQVPEEVVSKELFDSIHTFIIAKTQLQNKFLSIDVESERILRCADHIRDRSLQSRSGSSSSLPSCCQLVKEQLIIIGCPVHIQKDHYLRNALTFNMCFVLDGSIAPKDLVRYEMIVRKLSLYLKILELEQEYLSHADTNKRLPEIMMSLFTELNESRMCHLPINEHIAIHLQMWGDTSDRMKEEGRSEGEDKQSDGNGLSCIEDGSIARESNLPDILTEVRVVDRMKSRGVVHEVRSGDETVVAATAVERFRAVYTPRRYKVITVQEEDVPTICADIWSQTYAKLSVAEQQVLPYIDGSCNLLKIASVADIDINIVKQSVADLILYGLVSSPPILDYSNIYQTTVNIGKLMYDKPLQQQCLQHISIPGQSPCTRDMLEMYSYLTINNTVRFICSRLNPVSKGIDMRKLIEFGLEKEIIKRVHHYSMRRRTYGTARGPAHLGGPAHQQGTVHQQGSAQTSLQVNDVDGSSELSLLSRLEPFLTGSHTHDHMSCVLGISKIQLNELIRQDPNIITFSG